MVAAPKHLVFADVVDREKTLKGFERKKFLANAGLFRDRDDLTCFHCGKQFPLDTRGVYHTNCEHLKHKDNAFATLYTLSALVGFYHIFKGTCNLLRTVIKYVAQS